MASEPVPSSSSLAGSRGGGSTSDLSDSIQNVGNPFYLHPNENPSLILVSSVLSLPFSSPLLPWISFSPDFGYLDMCSMAHVRSFPITGGTLPCPLIVPSPAMLCRLSNNSIVCPSSQGISWNSLPCFLVTSCLSFFRLFWSSKEGSGKAFRPAKRRAIEEIINLYKTQFQQESVLRVTSVPVRVGFWN